MRLNEARVFAEQLCAKLRPHCDRIEIAGSIRRQRPEVKDIEIVCIPHRISTGLFGDDLQVDSGFITAVNSMAGSKGSPDGKYAQRVLKFSGGEIAVDIFMTTPKIWGSIFAIRTGSADFSHYALAKAWNKLGWRSKEGVLINEQGEEASFKEEQDLFQFLGMAYISPEFRDVAGEDAKKEYYRMCEYERNERET